MILGNSPELAREELKSLLKFNEINFSPPVLALETDDEIIFDRLGGTIKVAEVIESDIVTELSKYQKVDFGVSTFGQKLPNLVEIKRELVKKGIKVRFVLPKIGTELSSVVVKKQMLTEFIVACGFTAKTVWVQDFEAWNVRDYGRPAVEAHIGMLPPKVARQMLNISGGKTILDPFCGVGTILTEGLELGLNMIGSDIDSRQIERARKNLEFFGKDAPLYVCDARKIKEKIPPVDAIVTESDLGPRLGLEQLYAGCLLSWKSLVKPGGRVVMALPSTAVVDKAMGMGYILDAGPFIYARPQAKIKRNILVFRNGAY